MEKTQKTFAFRLAQQENARKREAEQTGAAKWRIRDGIAAAGCSDPTHEGMHRWGTSLNRDSGYWC